MTYTIVISSAQARALVALPDCKYIDVGYARQRFKTYTAVTATLEIEEHCQ